MTMKNALPRGFSLIELMVVIAIVALLVAVAVPTYKSYVQKSKLAEVYSLVSAAQTKAQQAIDTGGTVAETITTPGSYLSSLVTNSSGDITANFKAASVTGLTFGGVAVVYTRTAGNGGTYYWACSTTDSDAATATGCTLNT
mgnify:FL=1